jgi:hypothetical protein
VYWDAGLTIPAPLPIRTQGGYPINSGTPARLYVNSDYSIQVQNRNGSVVYTALSATERFGLSADVVSFVGFKGQSGFVADLADADGSNWIGFDPLPTGTIARSAQEKMQDIVSVADFGIVGGVDETAKLENLRQYAIANPGCYFDFRDMPTKELRYTTPKWMAEVQDATYDLRGISLRNLGAGTYGYADMDGALLVGSGTYFFNDQGTGQLDPAKATSGNLIQNANASDTGITLVTAGDAVNYSIGDRVLLNWYDRQGAASFPPNPGYFEWHVIKNIVGGAITFEKRLKYSYKSQAPDYTSDPLLYNVTSGKARILNLTRTGYTEAGHIRILGGIGVDTGSGTAGYRGALIVEGVALLEIDGGNFTAFFNNCSEKQVLKRCTFEGATTEFDKIVGTVIAEDTNFEGITQGTGVEVFEMTGGILGSQVQMRMRKIYLNQVQVRTTPFATAMLVLDQFPRQLIEVKDCEFAVPSGAACAVHPGNTASFTPDAITSTQITINTTNLVYTTIIQNIDLGQAITLNNGKPPENFYVTGLSFDSSNNLLIAGYCETATPSAGARILWPSVNFRHEGNIFRNAGPRFRMLLTGPRVWNVDSGTEGKVRVTQIMQYGEYTTLTTNCYVERITVDVVKPYTGTDTACTLDIAVEGAGQPQTYMAINGLIAGRRMRDQTGSYGAQSGDTLTAFPSLSWSESTILALQGDGGPGVFTDGALAALPLIRVVIEGYKPPFNKQEL